MSGGFRHDRLENRIRRGLAAELDMARQGYDWSLRRLADVMGTSLSQVQRVLHRDQGGSLTLLTIVRAADVLGFDVSIVLTPRQKDSK